MCIVGAIIGAAVIGAAGTAYASDQASSATRDATSAAITQQQKGLDQQATLSAPYRALGESAVPQLQSLLGIGGADPTQALRATPGYNFTLNQGLDATKNAASASGMLLSGNTLEGLDKFSTGLADQTYQQAVANTMGVVDLGQAAAAGQAANIGAASNNISNLISNQGNTLAGIDANTIAGITKSISGGINNYATAQTLAGLNSPGSSGGYPASGGFDPSSTTITDYPGGTTTYFGP